MTFSTLPMCPRATAHRIRLVFNGPATSNGYLLCAGEPPVLPPAPNGTVRVLAAFCRGSEPLSFVAADQGGPTDAADPAFTRFMRQVTRCCRLQRTATSWTTTAAVHRRIAEQAI